MFFFRLEFSCKAAKTRMSYPKYNGFRTRFLQILPTITDLGLVQKTAYHKCVNTIFLQF